MEPSRFSAPSRPPIFRGFEDSVERTFGADMRLLYGLAAPILMIVGLIVVLALTPATWLVVAIIVLELAALAVVLTGVMGVLNDERDADPDAD